MTRARSAVKKTPYQRIIRAAHKGVGVRLSPDECRALAMDGAIEQSASNDDMDQEEERERRRGSSK